MMEEKVLHVSISSELDRIKMNQIYEGKRMGMISRMTT